tara:strand:- start:237 stop:494 length:258 start_codon:yes stop_codon:yes gene_type:complete
MSQAELPTKSRLRWQCRRGMRELDVLLGAWLDNHYDSATELQKAGFCALLELPDPELAGYLLHGLPVSNPGEAIVVKHIRGETAA